MQGRLFRWGVASAIVLLGLTFPMMPVRIGAVAIAALVFFGVFPLVDSRLEALGKTLAASSRGEAAKLMSGLEERWMVSRFAPHVWVSAQKGRLNMIKGDPRAAAAAFAEAARQSGNAHQPDLVGSQAHALVLSGDPKGARQLLLGMEERKELRSLDAFNLGVAYVEEPGKTSRAVELLELARKDLGAAPRTDAALALAYARDGKTDEAASLLEAMDESGFDDDDTAKELHKRARRSLRQATESKGPKGKRKPGPGDADAADNAKPAKGKRDRRKDRREKRKARGGKKSRKGKRNESAPAEDKEEEAVAAKVSEPAPEDAAVPKRDASEKTEAGQAEQVAAEKAAEKASAEKATAEKAEAEKAAAEAATAAAETAAAENASAETAAAAKAEAEKKASAEKAAAEKAAAEKEAADKASTEKAAAEKEAAEKEAAEKGAAEKAAAEKEAAEKKAAADKAAEEREARARVVAATLARSAEEDDSASEEKAKAAAESAARAAAERARERAEAKANEGAAPEKPLFGSDSQPLFVPPPVPAFGSETGRRNGVGAATKPAAPKLPAPPKVAPPKVAAPPVVDSAAKKPAIDTDGWDDLFGDD